MKLLLALPVFLALAVCAPDASADKLKEIIHSREYQRAVKIQHHANKNEDDETNFGQLFFGHGEKSKIFKALGLEIEGYKIVSTQFINRDQFLYTYRLFQTANHKVNIDTTVIVPRPEYIDLFNQGLVVEANNILPPKSEILTRVPLEIGGEQGEVIQLQSGKTYIFIPLPRDAYFLASTDKAKNASYLTKLVQAFTFGELKRELNS